MISASPHTGALLFSVERERFALPLASVAEVVRGAWPMKAPRAPFGCLGLLDVRGDVVPLIDLAALLSLRRPLKEEELAERLLDAHLLIVHAGAAELALLVDHVHDIDAEAQPQPLKDAEREALRRPRRAEPVLIFGAVESGHQRALLLDPSALLGERRGRLVADFRRRGAGSGVAR